MEHIGAHENNLIAHGYFKAQCPGKGECGAFVRGHPEAFGEAYLDEGGAVIFYCYALSM